MREMSVEEMIEVLDDPDQRLGWRGSKAGPELEEQAREWAFGIFAGWETDRQVSHLLAVGVEEAADILGMASDSDKVYLLSLLPENSRIAVEGLLPIPGV